MIYQTPPKLPKQNLICLDVGTKKTGIAHNFENHSVAFVCKTVLTQNILQEIHNKLANFVIIGLPMAYPESQSYYFITSFVDFLQENLPNHSFIFWDETATSQEIRESYHHGRKGFRKKFHNNYDAKSASLILQSFIACNF